MESTTRKIPIDLIDDPSIAMRSSVHDESLQELMNDMRAVGLIEPIVVRPVGERYEVIAGHRRTTAARLLGWAHIESKIVSANDEKAFTMRAIENLSRHDVNPVDEACFIGELIKNTGKTADDMGKLLHRSKQWIDQRLEVFNMPNFLQEYIRQKRITLGAALELNRIQNADSKKYFANWAALNGCTVAQASRWVISANSEQDQSQIKLEQIVTAPNETPQTVVLVKCAKCGVQIPLQEADSVWVHRSMVCSSEHG